MIQTKPNKPSMSSEKEEEKKTDSAANPPSRRQSKRKLTEEGDPMTKLKMYLLGAADLWDRMRKEARKQELPMADDSDMFDQLGCVSWENEDGKGVTLELQTDLSWRVYADGWEMQDDHGSEDMYYCVKHIQQLLEERGITGNK